MRGLGLLVLAAACGDGIALPDAAVTNDGAERGIVRVHVIGLSSGFDTVYFQNADSTIALATHTNSDGDALALMASGGFVTVVTDNGLGVGGQLYTWTDVQIGDVLTLDFSDNLSRDTFPTAGVRIAALDGGVFYRVFSPCDAELDVTGAIDMQIQPFFNPCQAQVPLLLLARDASFRVIGYVYRSTANLLGAGPIDLRGSYGMATSYIDVLGPAGDSVSVVRKVNEVLYQTNTVLSLDGTHQQSMTEMPAIPGTTVQTVARTSSFDFPPGKEDGETLISSAKAVLVWGPPSATTSLDFTAGIPRDFTSSPTFDVTSFTLDWSETASGTQGDVVWARLDVNSINTQITWNLIARHTDETVVRLPVLPREDLRPSINNPAFVNDFAVITSEGGYDRLRPYLLGHWSPRDGVLWPMNEPSGQVTFRSLF